MMIQLGVAEILERQVPDPVESRVDVDGARVDLLQQAAQLVGIHLNLRVTEPWLRTGEFMTSDSWLTGHHWIVCPTFRPYFLAMPPPISNT